MAKQLADEAWDIDYRETETIAARAKERGVDGVIAGYSEIRVMAAMKLADALGLPFYTDRSTFDITRSKVSFKEACLRNGVSVPKYVCLRETYDPEVLRSLNFPVIVKPVDSAGRKGMRVCWDQQVLSEAISHAFDCSLCGEVIVEEYITGTEFTAQYTVSGGEIRLSILKDKYKVEEVAEKCLRNFSLAPSVNLERYLTCCNSAVCHMLKEIGVREGVAILQGMASESGFYFFEANYRLGSGNDQLLIERETGNNYMKMMIAHALSLPCPVDLEREDPHFRHYCGNLALYARGGVIKELSYPTVGELPAISDVLVHKNVGMEICEDGTLGQRVLSFFIQTESVAEMQRALEEIHSRVTVRDPDTEKLCRRGWG